MNLKQLKNKLKNKNVIITAGGTIEPIDPVRYIGNHSSGKMGIAIAKEISHYTSKLLLIIGKMSVNIPKNIPTKQIQTVNEMLKAIQNNLNADTILIMAAAVSDFKVKNPNKNKIKGNKNYYLELIPTIDILKKISRKKKKNNIFIGFAVETEDIITNAKKKLKEKNLDLIIANPINEKYNPFGSDYNKVYFISKDQINELPYSPKQKIAQELIKFLNNFIH